MPKPIPAPSTKDKFAAVWAELEKEKASVGLPDIFAERPVTLDEFIQNESYLGYPKLSDVQYEAIRYGERIFFPETYKLLEEAYGDYWSVNDDYYPNFLTIMWGKGSGKDLCVRIIVLRIIYLLLCLKSPQKYFGLPNVDSIHLLNIAMNAEQARRVFFKPLRETVISSPWFKDKFEDLEPAPLATSIRFKKNIEAISGHSMADQQEGLNLLVGVADEIAGFRTDDEIKQQGTRGAAKSASAIIDMMRTSGRTRFPKNFKLIQISFPRYDGDAIFQALEEAKKDLADNGTSSQYYYNGPYATWEVNPRISGKQDFASDYRTNPAQAAAKYECKPDASSGRFFQNRFRVESVFSKEIELSPLEVSYYWGIDDTDPESEKDGWQVKYDINPNLKPKPGALYALHFDMAINGDRAGASMCHVKKQIQDDTEAAYDDNPEIVMDFCVALESDANAHNPSEEHVPRDIQIRWAKKLVLLLIEEGFEIGSVTYDRFQSFESVQALNARGIYANHLSVDRNSEAYDTLKDIIYEGRLLAYKHELLIKEITGLIRLKNGKIDHLPSNSKDLSDALAGAVAGAIAIGGEEDTEESDLINVFSTVRSSVSSELDINEFSEMLGNSNWRRAISDFTF